MRKAVNRGAAAHVARVKDIRRKETMGFQLWGPSPSCPSVERPPAGPRGPGKRASRGHSRIPAVSTGANVGA